MPMSTVSFSEGSSTGTNLLTRTHTPLPSIVFLHPYAETSWDDQLTKESLAERTIRATVHAKRTLMAGFTAVRCVCVVFSLPPSSLWLETAILCSPTEAKRILYAGTSEQKAQKTRTWLRSCLSGPNALIPGPRYFCANRAIVATGSYGACFRARRCPTTFSDGTEVSICDRTLKKKCEVRGIRCLQTEAASKVLSALRSPTESKSV